MGVLWGCPTPFQLVELQMRSAQRSGHPGGSNEQPVVTLSLSFWPGTRCTGGVVQWGGTRGGIRGGTMEWHKGWHNRGPKTGGYIVPAAHPLATNGTTNWLGEGWGCPEFKQHPLGAGSNPNNTPWAPKVIQTTPIGRRK